MKITPRSDLIAGSFDTLTAELVAVPKQKYAEVTIAVRCDGSRSSMSFIDVRLHDGSMGKAMEAFEDAGAFAQEIVRRWNTHPDKR